jgi:hypothetical protein
MRKLILEEVVVQTQNEIVILSKAKDLLSSFQLFF